MNPLPAARPAVVLRELLLVAALLTLAQLDVWMKLASGPYHGPRALSAAIATVACGAVLWRARAPLAAQAAVIAAVAVSRLFTAHDTSFSQGFLPLIVLTASAAYHRRGTQALGALAAAELALAIVVLAEPSLPDASTFLSDSLFLVIPWLAATALRRRGEQARTLAVDLEALREREARVLAEERARIARELHDVVAHSVSIMVINAGAARLHITGDDRAAEPLAVVERTGREALTELRRLLGVLRTEPGEAGGAAAPAPALADVGALVEGVRATGVRVALEARTDVAALPAGLQVSAYRILQEALTNVVKHAGPGATATVRLTQTDRALDIEVLDDGAGAAAGPGLPSAGHGLLGARERSALFGGWAQAGPRPGGGWRLAAHLPLAAEPVAATAGEPVR